MTIEYSEQGVLTDHRTRRAGAVGHINSYYAETGPTLSYYAPLEQDRDCEICIIGGGLAGLTAAAELARARKETVLVESNRIAWAASGRNGGFVAPGFARGIFDIEKRFGLDHAQQLYRLSNEGVAYVRSTIRKAKANHIIGGDGWLSMIRHKGTNLLERRAERMVRDYDAMQSFVSVDELEEHVASEKYHGGIMDMGCFHIQPLEYAGLLAANAKRSGAAIHENSPADSIERDGSKWKINVGRQVVSAHHVLVATSVYGGPLRDLNRALVPVATYVVAAKSPGGRLGDAIRFGGCLSDFRRANDYYRLVGEKDDPTLIWGGRITTRKSQPAKLTELLLADIHEVFPQLDDLVVTHAWSGLMAYPVYKMPIVRQVDESLWVATGFGGHGLNTTAMAGNLIASAISAGDDRYRLFSPYRPKWAGGAAGRVAAQLEYWRLKLFDKFSERIMPG